MSALANKEIPSIVAPAKPAAKVLSFSGKQGSRIDLRRAALTALQNVVPPAVVLALVLLLWQALCSSADASLPSPHQVWQDSYDLIAYPFFNYGSQDIGLGWRVLV